MGRFIKLLKLTVSITANVFTSKGENHQQTQPTSEIWFPECSHHCATLAPLGENFERRALRTVLLVLLRLCNFKSTIYGVQNAIFVQCTDRTMERPK